MPNRYRADQIHATAKLAAVWLADEQAVSPDSLIPEQHVVPANRFNEIVTDELPKYWDRYQAYQEVEDEVRIGDDVPATASMQTNQQILKLCAAAGEARVWELVIGGSRPDQAKWRSQQEATVHLSDINHLVKNLPRPGELRQSFGRAVVSHVQPVQPTDSQPRLLIERTADLAVARLLEQGNRDEVLYLPMAGLPSGILDLDLRSEAWPIS